MGCDANREQRMALVDGLVETVSTKFGMKTENDLKDLQEVFNNSGLADITEYGRAVHAEMEAIISAGRLGVSIRDCTLFCTTFPCHNCAKHVVASGIKRLVYIEPYPKSKALSLHYDSIVHQAPNGTAKGKVSFQPFIGIGPRRFLDLFSIKHGSSLNVKRAIEGKALVWKSDKVHTRLPMWANTYLERELTAIEKLGTVFSEGGEQDVQETKD